MGDILELLVPWAVTTYGMFALLAWDESRLPPDELARAWPVASRRIAVVYFGVLSLPVHFWRTRRSALGLAQGLAWGVGVALLNEGVAEGRGELVKRLPLP